MIRSQFPSATEPALDVLVTGGAGFIGSHLVHALVERGDHVRVVDNLFSGRRENIPADVRWYNASVSDEDAMTEAMAGVDTVFHEAAHGAVARSVANPLATDTANVHGTVTVLKTALDAGVRRVVFASSSSMYGGVAPLPTREDHPTRPRSPYAVSKQAAESYVRVFAELFPMETVALRYFNVYGPRQRPDSTYAAVIPLFTRALLMGEPLTVFGDGRQSRDFTFVSDVVAANLAAAAAPGDMCSGRVYNVAAGRPHDLLELVDTLAAIIRTEPRIEYGPPRPGDVKDSHADVAAAAADLGWRAAVPFEDGLTRAVAWMRSEIDPIGTDASAQDAAPRA